VWFLKNGLGYGPNQVAWCWATFAVTFGLAALSYRFFESRLLALKHRFPTRPR